MKTIVSTLKRSRVKAAEPRVSYAHGEARVRGVHTCPLTSGLRTRLGSGSVLPSLPRSAVPVPLGGQNASGPALSCLLAWKAQLLEVYCHVR